MLKKPQAKTQDGVPRKLEHCPVTVKQPVLTNQIPAGKVVHVVRFRLRGNIFVAVISFLELYNLASKTYRTTLKRNL